MLLSLDGRGPRYTQITRALVSQIRHGALAPGSRAPSSRELARDTGCSRNVVLLAYEQLLIEGLLREQAAKGPLWLRCAKVRRGARCAGCARLRRVRRGRLRKVRRGAWAQVRQVREVRCRLRDAG
jgi:DNA-binding transcriptional MocR family regulator